MTHDEWEAHWEAQFKLLRKIFPEAKIEAMQVAARRHTETKYGPQPPKAPLAARVGIAIAQHKLKDMNMNPTLFRILNALVFGVGSFIAALQAGTPTTTEGWISLGVAALIAAYGKYSSSQTLIAPNRPEWTPEQRAAVQPK